MFRVSILKLGRMFFVKGLGGSFSSDGTLVQALTGGILITRSYVTKEFYTPYTLNPNSINPNPPKPYAPHSASRPGP